MCDVTWGGKPPFSKFISMWKFVSFKNGYYKMVKNNTIVFFSMN